VENIQCNPNLKLVIKHDGSPVYVKSDNVVRIAEVVGCLEIHQNSKKNLKTLMD